MAPKLNINPIHRTMLEPSQNLLSSRARTIERGTKTYFSRKIGGGYFFSKMNLGGEGFYQKKMMGRRIISTGKGGERGGEDFFRQIFPKIRPRFPLDFDRSLRFKNDIRYNGIRYTGRLPSFVYILFLTDPVSR